MRELEDRKWFPEFLRRHQMEYLTFLASTFKIYHPVRELLVQAIHETQSNELTDTCSGSGGPIPSLNLPCPVLLTDLYPPGAKLTSETKITYHPQPVNLQTSLPPGQGVISMFNGFHHFTDQSKYEIVRRAKASNRALFIVEILQPGFRHFISVLFTTTIGHWLTVPFMKPFTFSRIVFTYFIPLHTLTICLDGIISVFKSKSPGFYKKFCRQLSSDDYRVQLIETKGISGKILILQGTPTQ